MNKDQLGKFIKAQRGKVGLTQKALAEKCKCRRQAILELERNQCETGFSFIVTILENLGYELYPVQVSCKIAHPPKSPSAPVRFDFTVGKDEPPPRLFLKIQP